MASILYTDLNANLGERGDALVYNFEAVRQGIFNILTTVPGEAGPIFEPEFGSLIYNLLAEPLDDRTSYALRGATIQALQRWEPRIELDLSKTSITPVETIQGYEVNIYYRLVETSEPQNVSLFLRKR